MIDTTASMLPPRSLPLGPLRELRRREPRLTRFGLALLALLVPFAIAALFDDRSIRDVNVWVKPIKFAASIAVMALTSAWFAGALPAPVRAGRTMRIIVRLVQSAGGGELAYISVQAALGQGSHYFVADPFHAAMYGAMGIGAMCLAATQPLLAWLLWRYPDRTLPMAYRQAVLVGLTLTFACGAGVGALLGGLQTPAGVPALPVIGWSLVGGDLRPAHFVGIHAEQLLPLVGLVAAAVVPRRATTVVWIATAAYAALFTVLVVAGLSPVRA